MKVEKYKNLMVLILLIFVGQVVSAPITTCKTNNHDESQTMMSVEADMHMSHNMQISPSSNNNHTDMVCCDEDCDCPLGICLSVVLYSNENLEILFSTSSNYIPLEIPFINNQPSSSIYHPPIFS